MFIFLLFSMTAKHTWKHLESGYCEQCWTEKWCSASSAHLAEPLAALNKHQNSVGKTSTLYDKEEQQAEPLMLQGQAWLQFMCI